MARLGRTYPIRAHTLPVRGTMVFTTTLTENLIGTDSVVALKIILSTLTENLIGTDSIARSIARSISEGLIGTDTVLKSMARALTERLIGTDVFTASSVFLRTLTENLIGTDTLKKLLNGSSTVWVHVVASTAAVWSKVTKSTSTWTHIDHS